MYDMIIRNTLFMLITYLLFNSCLNIEKNKEKITPGEICGTSMNSLYVLKTLAAWLALLV